MSFALPWAVGIGSPGWPEGGLLLVLGLFAGLGHWLVISAYLLAPASLLTPFTYLQMTWATVYGWAIFGPLPDRWSALGMVIIVATGLWPVVKERLRTADRSRAAAQ